MYLSEPYICYFTSVEIKVICDPADVVGLGVTWMYNHVHILITKHRIAILCPLFVLSFEQYKTCVGYRLRQEDGNG